MADEEPRRRWNVGAIKIPRARRDVARGVMRTAEDARARGYHDIMGADTNDNDERFPVGAHVLYSLELTEAEAEAFAAASNARYVNPDRPQYPHRAVGRPTGLPEIPTPSTLAYMRTRYVDLRRWHGRDVPVAVVDQGTTAAIRAKMGLTLIARSVFGGANLGGQETFSPAHEHGCLVASNAVPAGGLLLDAVVSDQNGGFTVGGVAAGVIWAVDNGAKVINLSLGGGYGVPYQEYQDAFIYARDHGNVQIVASAGNDNTPDLNIPASGSRLFANVHSSIAFDEATDRRALFSNYHADGSGCAPGVDVDSLDIYGYPTWWSGTSASAPQMTHLIARGATGSTFTTAQVATALRNNARNTNAGSSQQGRGAWDLHRALAALGAIPSATAGVVAPTHVNTRGTAGFYSDITVAPTTGAQVDNDMQIVIAVSGPVFNKCVTPPGWVEIHSREWNAGYERGEGTVPNIHNAQIQVFAKPVAAGDPPGTRFAFTDDKWAALSVITVRAAGGLDPERFVPMSRAGYSSSVQTVEAAPATTNDLQVCVFAQWQATAANAITLSLPTGLTQQGFFRSSDTGAGYAMLVATRALTDASRTPVYTSTANAIGFWTTATFTIPAGVAPIAPVVQTEPAGSPGAFLPFYGGNFDQPPVGLGFGSSPFGSARFGANSP